MNFLKIKENALKYLGYHGQNIDDSISYLIDECLEEIDEMASFKVIYKIFPLAFDPLLIKEADIYINYPDLNDLLAHCHDVAVIACTLGIQVDKRAKYYSLIDMTKMTIFDAIASSYLEAKCDDYEKKHIIGKRTFRFCPGYGNVPIELNKKLARVVDSHRKIGLTVQDSHILLPQKSMIGLIGLGDNGTKKSCKNCLNIKNCDFRKRGQTCYKID